MRVADGGLVSEHAEVAQRNASTVARERLGNDDDARHEHHDDDVETRHLTGKTAESQRR